MPIPISDQPKEPPKEAPKDTRSEHIKGLVANLWRSREDGDFVFNCSGCSIRAHGCILSAASPVFKAMLASGMAEGLSSSMAVDAEPAELLAMLRFVYLGELDATGQQLPGVLALAHRYEVLDLIPPICEAMIENLCEDTVVSYVRVLRLLESAPYDSNVSSDAAKVSDDAQAWMALPATGSPPSIPPAARVTCTGLSRPTEADSNESNERLLPRAKEGPPTASSPAACREESKVELSPTPESMLDTLAIPP
ncbi:unnamed protein product [Effrenium voratum]|nr:unnamed protein product [Effrenium voratum]